MHQSHTVKERVNKSVVGLQVGEVVVTKVVAFGATSEMPLGKRSQAPPESDSSIVAPTACVLLNLSVSKEGLSLKKRFLCPFLLRPVREASALGEIDVFSC